MPAEMDDDLSDTEDDEVVAIPAAGSSAIQTTATATGLRPRAASLSSNASSLTDPEDLELLDETDDENADDEIIEINSDGSNKASARIAELVKRPPSEPKHRWETAYVWAFIQRFTKICESSFYAPQTIFEFEQALQSGATPYLPESTDEEFVPSLEPVFLDFIGKLRAADRASGGSGGPKGGWQAWIPWWINVQRRTEASEFETQEWHRVTVDLRGEKGAIYTIPWAKRLVILRAFVDAQLSVCEPLRNKINEAYGYGKVGDAKEKKDKEEFEKAAAEQLEAAQADNGKGKGKAPPTLVYKEPVNHLLIKPIGSDSRQCQWLTIDNSPRLYVTGKFHLQKPAFVAVSDTVEDFEEILESLHKPPPPEKDKNGNIIKIKAKRPKTPKEKAVVDEQKLYTKLTALLSPLQAEHVPYFAHVKKITASRTNAIKKKEREARQAALVAERAANKVARAQNPVQESSRTSGRTRNSRRKSADSYDEDAADDDLERALRESEREHRRKRRRSGSDAGEAVDYSGMDLDTEEDEEYDELEDDDVPEVAALRRSSRAAATRPTKVAIPPERRSARTRGRADDRDSSPEYVVSVPSTSRRMSMDPQEEPEPEAPKFGGLEEVWSKGRYTGYFDTERNFVKAEKGDVPLYKLAKLGLPMPNEPGYRRAGENGNEDALVDELAESSTSMPSSAVPTLEPENGNESRNSPVSANGKPSSPEVSAVIDVKTSPASKANGHVPASHLEVIIP